MPLTKEQMHCPHCGESLKKFRMPAEMGWCQEIHLACFNNDCPYFKRGWEWMREQFEVTASYRYRIDPETGVSSPLAVWSETALIERIIES